MTVGGWVVIIVVAALLIGAVAFAVAGRRRTKHLQEQFGPEYDRTIEADGRRKAEAELLAREERRDQLNIRPLPEGARERYSAEWKDVQAGFVDAPDDAVRQADDLVNQVMSDRGYPMDDFDQRASDISVDHPLVVENYRAAHRVYASVKRGNATTEEERMAMRHYRSLFDELLEEAASSASWNERTATTHG